MADLPFWSTGILGTPSTMDMLLATETTFIRGVLVTSQRRLSDVLNAADRPYLLLEQVEMTEASGDGETIRTAHAQVNLDAVLFAVADVPVLAPPELATPKAVQMAYVSLPPYRIVGRIHLAAGEDLRNGLDLLAGRFVPVTDAVYWSRSLGVERTEALMVAVNHSRANILAPFPEIAPDTGA